MPFTYAPVGIEPNIRQGGDILNLKIDDGYFGPGKVGIKSDYQAGPNAINGFRPRFSWTRR